ncbi:MAG: response regulator [Candidatus Omnitrophota bacterium]
METKTILVVDDQRDIQLLLKTRLEAAGYSVIQALDGEEGLWQVIEHKPHLILADVVMPKINGIEFLKRLRDVDGGEDAPVIVLSNRPQMVNCFEEDGIEGFYPKPFDMDALLSKIKAVLTKQETFQMLKEIQREKEKKAEQKDKQHKDSRYIEVCKRCGTEKEDIGDTTHCPQCGCSEFFIKDIND